MMRTNVLMQEEYHRFALHSSTFLANSPHHIAQMLPLAVKLLFGFCPPFGPFLFVPVEGEQGDEGNEGEEQGEIDEAVEAPDAGKDAAEAVAEELTEAEEDGVEAHEQTTITRGLL